MRDDELEPMSPSMRDLLSTERPLDPVPAEARARVLARATATIAGVAVAGAATSAAASAAKGGVAAKAALTTKVIIAAVAFSVGGGVGAGVHAVVRPSRPAPVPAPIVIRMETPAPAPVPPVVAPPVPEPAPVPKPGPQRRADTLEAERSLVEQARAAFARNDPAAALVTLNQHEREYPNGQLAEERMALQIIALADSGADAKARDLAKKFRARFPQSLLMPAVESRAPAP